MLQHGRGSSFMKTKYCFVLFRIFLKGTCTQGWWWLLSPSLSPFCLLSPALTTRALCSRLSTLETEAQNKKIHIVMGTFLGRNIKFSYVDTSAKYGHFGYFQSLLGPCLYKYKWNVYYRHHYMKDVYVSLPKPGNTRAMIAVSVVARAMKEMNKVAIVRCVWRQRHANVVIGVLTPNLSDKENIVGFFCLCFLYFISVYLY